MTSPDHFLAGLSIGAVYSAVCGISSHKRIPYFAAFILCGVSAMLPDIDAFRGVYSSTDPLIGHRGITHSLFFAALVSVISVIVYLSGRVVLRYSKNLLWVDLFVILFLAVTSHLLLDLPTPAGIWKGIPVFFPLKDGGQFARVGGWNKIGWFDYRITWILFVSVSVSIVVFVSAIFLKRNVFIKKILYSGILIICIISYFLITSTIASSSFKNSKAWNESQSRYVDTLPEFFKRGAVYGRGLIFRIIK